MLIAILSSLTEMGLGLGSGRAAPNFAGGAGLVGPDPARLTSLRVVILINKRVQPKCASVRSN